MSTYPTDIAAKLVGQFIAVRVQRALSSGRPLPSEFALVLAVRDDREGMAYAVVQVQGAIAAVIGVAQADLAKPYATIQLHRSQIEALLTGAQVDPELSFETAPILGAVSQALQLSNGVSPWRTRL